MESFKKYLAEFFGTAALVFFGCGTAVSVNTSVSGGGYILTALAFGMVLTALIYVIGNISGCHVNPAVSLAMLINKKIDVIDFIGYVVFQLLGSLAGSALVLAILGKKGNLGANGLTGVGGSTAKGLVVELVLTFIFVLVILAVTGRKENSNIAGMIIGIALTLVHILGINLTGTSVNPARSIGPALLAGSEALGDLWVFIVAPLFGAAIAALVYKLFTIKKEEDKEEEPEEKTEDKSEEQK